MNSWLKALGMTGLIIAFAGFSLGAGLLIIQLCEEYPVLSKWIVSILVFAGLVTFIRWVMYDDE